MSGTKGHSGCQAVCWILSGMVGVGLAVVAGPFIGGLFAAALGVIVVIACGAFLQRHICGLALDDWGPFEGLKGVPGWDANPPFDPPARRPEPTPTKEPEPSVGISSTLLAGEEALAATKGSWRYEG
ncbi:hypothetical protein [Tropicibacter sp. S64]|uniref:hypothetical protein n=1 Tax=Tropicibacter sp. S64 TaxID=3415122 RepID=UPI003C7D01FB